MSTIADRMDVMADAMEEIGQVDWAATLRGLAKEVRALEEKMLLFSGRWEYYRGTVRAYSPDSITVVRTYTLDKAAMIRERDVIERAVHLTSCGMSGH